MVKNRDKSIDALKGLGILCIVFLHYSNTVMPTWSYIWISRFMITAFYFTSGWLSVRISAKEITVKTLFFKRLKTLGIPYLSFTLLILCFDLIWLCIGFYDLKYIAKDVYKTLVLKGIGTLWFLPALMGGELVVLWLRRLNTKFSVICAFSITLICVGLYDYWLAEYRNIDYRYQIIDAPIGTIVAILRAWPVIFAGYIISKYIFNKWLHTSNRFEYAIIGILVSIISIFTCDYFINLSMLKWFVTPIIAPFGLLMIFKGLIDLKIISFFTYWGRNSLIVMATHYSIIQVICMAICERLLGLSFQGWVTVLFFLVTILVEVPIVYFINHKMKFMLGKY